LSNQWVKEEVTRKIGKYLETNENKNTIYQTYRMQQKSNTKRELYRGNLVPL